MIHFPFYFFSVMAPMEKFSGNSSERFASLRPPDGSLFFRKKRWVLTAGMYNPRLLW